MIAYPINNSNTSIHMIIFTTISLVVWYDSTTLGCCKRSSRDGRSSDRERGGCER